MYRLESEIFFFERNAEWHVVACLSWRVVLLANDWNRQFKRQKGPSASCVLVLCWYLFFAGWGA